MRRSHCFLTHEFIDALKNDAVTPRWTSTRHKLNYTVPGIIAHLSLVITAWVASVLEDSSVHATVMLRTHGNLSPAKKTVSPESFFLRRETR